METKCSTHLEARQQSTHLSVDASQNRWNRFAISRGCSKKLDLAATAGKIDDMVVAKQPAPEESAPLSWTEICARYPDQFVCLVDIVDIELGSPEIETARVVGRGATHEAAFEPIRDHLAKYRVFEVRFTGVWTGPLIRPALVIDDEILEFLNS